MINKFTKVVICKLLKGNLIKPYIKKFKEDEYDREVDELDERIVDLDNTTEFQELAFDFLPYGCWDLINEVILFKDYRFWDREIKKEQPYEFWLNYIKYGHENTYQYSEYLIDYVPEKYLTQELCMYHIVRNGVIYPFGGLDDGIPEKKYEKVLTSELFEAVIEEDGEMIDILYSIPEHCITKDIVKKYYVEYDNDEILDLNFETDEEMREYVYEYSEWRGEDYVPLSEFKNITKEKVLRVVKNNPSVLKFLIPEEFQTEEVCLEAVKTNGYALEFVPEEFQTEEVCLEAVKQNGRALKFVPEQLKTEEVCLEAVKEDGFAINAVPEHLLNDEIRQCKKRVNPILGALCGLFGLSNNKGSGTLFSGDL